MCGNASTSCLYDETIYGNFIKKILDISLQLSGFDVIIYFSDHGFDKDKAYFIQLLILMGKFHTHKMKWSGSKPNFSHFINDFKLYCYLFYFFVYYILLLSSGTVSLY